MSQDYVYTLEAMRARFRRGAEEVSFFMPYTGRIYSVRRENWTEGMKELRVMYNEVLRLNTTQR